MRGYECGPDRETTICTIANLLQEVASNHAVALWGRTEAGFATDPIMVEKGLIFAATRIQIQMDAYPSWGDMLAMETWFQEEGRVAACRNWTLSDALSGRALGRATSTWVMVNVATRRLAKMPDEMRSKMPLLAPNPPRDSVAPKQSRRKLPDLDDGPATASFDGAVFEGPVQTARRADMDMNGHINNVTYLAWVLETVPADVIAKVAAGRGGNRLQGRVPGGPNGRVRRGAHAAPARSGPGRCVLHARTAPVRWGDVLRAGAGAHDVGAA